MTKIKIRLACTAQRQEGITSLMVENSFFDIKRVAVLNSTKPCKKKKKEGKKGRKKKDSQIKEPKLRRASQSECDSA